MKIKSYCINLERATERKLQFEKNWRSVLGVSLEYVKAIDRRDINASEYLTDGQLACLRSHIKIMQKALNTDFEYFLIFEDDAIPEYENVIEIVQCIYENTNFDIIHYCLKKHLYKIYNFESIQTNKITIIDGMPPRLSEGAFMVFYTRKGMQQYLNTFSSEIHPADWYHKLPHEVKICTIVPALASHVNKYSYISTNYGRTFLR